MERGQRGRGEEGGREESRGRQDQGGRKVAGGVREGRVIADLLCYRVNRDGITPDQDEDAPKDYFCDVRFDVVKVTVVLDLLPSDSSAL